MIRAMNLLPPAEGAEKAQPSDGDDTFKIPTNNATTPTRTGRSPCETSKVTDNNADTHSILVNWFNRER